jgi:hypothetical protein
MIDILAPLKDLLPRVVCKDGVTLSVQASRTHYCLPRDDLGPYVAFEVGFPSVKPPRTWKQYCEDWKTPTETVYSCVPASVVERFIKRHGGLKSGRLPDTAVFP